MKIRNGFVSNSSSSSFCIYVKDEKMPLEERKEKTLKVLESYCAPYDDEDRKWYLDKAQKIVEDGRYLAIKKSVDYGGEESIKEIIPEIFKLLGVDCEKITYEWEE